MALLACYYTTITNPQTLLTTADKFFITSSFRKRTTRSPISLKTFSRLASSSCCKNKDEFGRMKDELPSTNRTRIRVRHSFIREKIRGWSFHPTYSRTIPTKRYAVFSAGVMSRRLSPFSVFENGEMSEGQRGRVEVFLL
jgi:hypothetical protein